jgi:hypothetical protein
MGPGIARINPADFCRVPGWHAFSGFDDGCGVMFSRRCGFLLNLLCSARGFGDWCRLRFVTIAGPSPECQAAKKAGRVGWMFRLHFVLAFVLSGMIRRPDLREPSLDCLRQ